MTRLLGALAASLVALAGPAGSSASPPTHPSCSAVTTTIAHQQHYNLAFRARCNSRVLRLRLQSSRSLLRISPSPVLEHPDQGDSLSCERRAPKVARCLGDVGENVRIVGELKLRGRPCARPLPRVRFRAFGGEDCDEPGGACPAIAYSVGVRVSTPGAADAGD